ncbi:hypothetical protein ACJ72_08118 [Emergomyces africanus]|uniref:Uncharacterized protein n=1 Tax=Emergomyces africanus TaxID=1955775 RepID=A0A1B7NLD3_9EURO|nr:hypothetical protein ACJ72_08118 [Emergomyces africanus]
MIAHQKNDRMIQKLIDKLMNLALFQASSLHSSSMYTDINAAESGGSGQKNEDPDIENIMKQLESLILTICSKKRNEASVLIFLSNVSNAQQLNEEEITQVLTQNDYYSQLNVYSSDVQQVMQRPQDESDREEREYEYNYEMKREMYDSSE